MLNLKIPLLVCLLASSASAQMAIEFEKMNALYPACADNNFTLVVNDIPDSNLILIPSSGNIEHTGEGKYRWDIITRDTNLATLEVWDRLADTLLRRSIFRVKPIPSPTPRLAIPEKNSIMGNGEYTKYVGGLALLLSDFDFDLRCQVLSYDIRRISKGNFHIVHNKGARYGSEAQDSVSRGIPGDQYIFENIRYTCGCDPMLHYMKEGLVYRIK